jgi:hypothetical protein
VLLHERERGLYQGGSQISVMVRALPGGGHDRLNSTLM